MKKSLSLVVSSALVFSLFSSVAFAADATTTSTAPTTQEMMKDLGFSGTDHDYLDRASAAVSILKGLGIEVDNTATLSFTDVNASDAWAPYIATAAKLGIVHGVDGTHFQPFEKVSQQDYAIMLTLGYAAKTGQKVDTTATTDVNAADYAKPYIKAAIDLGLLDASTDWSGTAGYDWMVKGAYNAKVAVTAAQAPAKVSVASAKATGVQKVEVTLNKAVDTDKATLSLKKGTISVATSTAWSDDKKTATLTLTDTKISAGDYSVTLAGLDASAIDTASASFTAQNETVQKIDFVSASDTISESKFANVTLKATNQYGETASAGASGFSAFVMGTQITPTKDSDGNLVVKFDTTGGGAPSVISGSPIPGSTQIPVIVYYNDNRVTAQKTFTLGNAPFLSKVDLGDVTYSNGDKKLSNAGDTASIAAKFYDQYGNQIVAGQIGTATTDEIKQSTVNVVTSPYNQHLTFDNTVKSNIVDTNDNTRILLTLDQKQDKSQDYTVTVYGGSASATATVSVGAAKIATTVDFGSFSDVVAAGDTDVYLPLVATDANGDQLTAQELVDNYVSDPGRFSFTATNLATGTKPVIVETGDKKGKLHLQLDSTTSARSTVYATAMVNSINTNSYKQFSFQIQEQRRPDHVKVVTAPADKAILGATTAIKFELDDQYGSSYGTHNSIVSIPDVNGQTAQYRVVLTLSGDTATSGITLKDEAATPNTILDNTTKTATYSNTNYDALNSEMKFYTIAGSTGTVTVKAVVQKSTDGKAISDSTKAWSDFSGTISRSVEAVPADTDLTYSMGDLATAYAIQDKVGLVEANPIDSKNDLGAATSDGISDTIQPIDSLFHKQVSISAKDSAGHSVALPDNEVRGIRTSNPDVAVVKYDGSNDAYVLGNHAGTATVTAVVYTNKGNTIVLTKDVTVKDDTISVDHFSVDNSTVAYTTQPDVFNLVNDIHVFDQYGDEFKGKDANGINQYAKALGLTYTTKVTSGSGTVDINAETGAINTVPSTVKEFVLTITAPNGKSIEVTVTH